MGKKVTIQDIADALGISRNTVSKAINNSEGLADGTREKILQKAVEMGYKQFSYVASLSRSVENSFGTESLNGSYSGEIALLSTSYLPSSHFASLFLDKFHREIMTIGFSPVMHIISADNLKNRTLPMSFRMENTRAILCVELFDQGYSEMIAGLGLPTLFVDGPANIEGFPLNTDLLLMDNTTEITRFVNEMIRRGKKRIGFIGDYTHCRSFYERYSAFRLAMLMNSVPTEDKFLICMTDRDKNAMSDQLLSLDEMPDIFICANDFVAIDAMQALAERDGKPPENVGFLGFDDSHESRIFSPALSTVHIHTQIMAFSALHLLISRINEPTMDFRIIYSATDLVLRASTEF
ncbi:MAG: LacI family DNA-binding transcriptional regulator [Solobacterium sp.]|nr:LacI family DNA-binding transcriptional regulator [Solobacterium sp.]